MTVGQELPLWEVPAPSTKPANEVVKNRLGAFVYRWFRNPIHKGVLQIEDVRRFRPSFLGLALWAVFSFGFAEHFRPQWRRRSVRSCRIAVALCAAVTWEAGGC
jgi:hypothetical protein